MAVRKDYIHVAAIMHREHEKLDSGVKCDPRTVLNIIGNKLASYFKDDSSKFDWRRFADACSTTVTRTKGLAALEGYERCTECFCNIDEETLEKYDGMCADCDRKFQLGE